jgi:hypothetical protein
MKNNSQSSLFFLSHSLKALKPEPPIKLSEQSPYLRAVLSDKRASGTTPVVSLANSSSLAAALRYISNSK